MRIGIECVHQKDGRQTHDKHDVHDGSNMHRGLRLNSGIFVFPQIHGSADCFSVKNIKGIHVKQCTAKVVDAKIVEYNTDVKISFLVDR